MSAFIFAHPEDHSHSNSVGIDVLARFLGVPIEDLVSPHDGNFFQIYDVQATTDHLRKDDWIEVLRYYDAPEGMLNSLVLSNNPGRILRNAEPLQPPPPYKITRCQPFCLREFHDTCASPDSPLSSIYRNDTPPEVIRANHIRTTERELACESKEVLTKTVAKLTRKIERLQRQLAKRSRKASKADKSAWQVAIHNLRIQLSSKEQDLLVEPRFHAETRKELLELWRAAPNFSDCQRARIIQEIRQFGDWLVLARQDRSLSANHPGAFHSIGACLLDQWEDWMERDLGKAALILPHFLIAATRRLNALSEWEPDRFRRLTQQCISWPVLVSKHPKFWPDHRELLKHLGDKRPVNDVAIHWQADWDPKDNGTKTAWMLLSHVNEQRQETFRLMTMCDATLKEVEPGVVRDLALLPDFGPGEAAVKWWKVARAIFTECFENPSAHPELRDLAYSAKRHRHVSGGRRITKGRLNSDILKNLRGRFISLAGRNKAWAD